MWVYFLNSISCNKFHNLVVNQRINKMYRSFYYFSVVLSIFTIITILSSVEAAIWNNEINCPMICNCRFEHLTESAIYKYVSSYKETTKQSFPSQLDNEAIYYDDVEEFNINIKSATCMLLSETNPLNLLEEIPKDIESLTLIQGYDSGNKTLKFEDFQIFPDLIILALKGAHALNTNFGKLVCDIDKELPIKYLDFEKVLLKSTKKYMRNTNEVTKFTFEYVQNLDPNLHPLTLVKKVASEKIIPYRQYKEQQKDYTIPIFAHFNNLIMLRVSGCDLNEISWEMFEDLNSLQNLILEDNNLKFIPDFAFYGVPNLISLSLSKNHLLNLQITNLAGLLKLEYLDLSYNNFSQLSELSLPPFPKLKLVNFRNNPISVVFPNTFEVLNTTDSIILGSEDTLLSLLTDSFVGLHQLRKLTVNNLKMPILKREVLTGIPNLRELTLTGNIPELEYDAFAEVSVLEKLILKNCNIETISMDAFLGLNKLKILDLSKNKLETLAPGTFDDLINLHELYLNLNKFTTLPKDIFAPIHPKLLRLNDNLWHCSCDMSLWKPMIVNRIKQRAFRKCENTLDKSVGCTTQSHIYKYIYENRVAPKCSTPKKFQNWSVFHSMRKGLKCSEFKPKYKKHIKSTNITRDIYEQTANIHNIGQDVIESITEENIKKNRKASLIRKYMLNEDSYVNSIHTNKIIHPNHKKISQMSSNNKINFDNNI